jgi:hypothetical protein
LPIKPEKAPIPKSDENNEKTNDTEKIPQKTAEVTAIVRNLK